MPANRATTARIISAYSIGIRWRASLFADSKVGQCCEVCHPVSTSPRSQSISLGRGHCAFDHKPPRADPGHAYVSLEGMQAGGERLPGHDEHAQSPAEGQIEAARQRRATHVAFDLDVVAPDTPGVQAEGRERP